MPKPGEKRCVDSTVTRDNRQLEGCEAQCVGSSLGAFYVDTYLSSKVTDGVYETRSADSLDSECD